MARKRKLRKTGYFDAPAVEQSVAPVELPKTAEKTDKPKKKSFFSSKEEEK